MEGSDMFNFYHPADLLYLKESYQNIMAEQGKPFKSRPYRFKVKNGCYITMETVFSCFINPWSKKLEFVDAKHVILKGPSNRDVFAEPGETMEPPNTGISSTTPAEQPNQTSSGNSEEVSDTKQVKKSRAL